MTASPINLDDAGRIGAECYGLPVVRMVLVLADGRKVALDLPNGNGTAPAGELSPMQLAVSQVVDEMAPGDVLSHEEIADRAGYACSGSLKAFVRTLAQLGRIRRTLRGWTKI